MALTLALISIYNPPDRDLLLQSHNTLWSVKCDGNEKIQVVDVEMIQSVVALVPHSEGLLGQEWKNRFFVVEKPGLEVACMGNILEQLDDEELDAPANT